MVGYSFTLVRKRQGGESQVALESQAAPSPLAPAALPAWICSREAGAPRPRRFCCCSRMCSVAWTEHYLLISDLSVQSNLVREIPDPFCR